MERDTACLGDLQKNLGQHIGAREVCTWGYSLGSGLCAVGLQLVTLAQVLGLSERQSSQERMKCVPEAWGHPGRDDDRHPTITASWGQALPTHSGQRQPQQGFTQGAVGLVIQA